MATHKRTEEPPELNGVTPPQGGQWFATTHWSVVLAARDWTAPQAEAALESLCCLYRPPILAFIRRSGHRPEEAEDLTQEFFARLLEKHYLNAADASKGRFRTLLLTAVSRFLCKERDRAGAQKRGGDVTHLSLDTVVENGGSTMEPADPSTPESIFNRRWAQTVLETVLGRLREEFESSGQRERFESLKPFLATEDDVPPAREIAARLGIRESSVYSAATRLRQRYGLLLREEIGRTVSSPEQIDEELQHLVQALTG